MKNPPRSKFAATELTLPESGLKVRVLGSPNVMKLAEMGKLPAPIMRKMFETLVDAQREESVVDPYDTAQSLRAYQAALVCAVVECVYWEDEDDEGNAKTYELPVTLDVADTDECYPVELFTETDLDYIVTYANEGVAGLATFPSDSESIGTGDAVPAVSKPKSKRAAGAK